MFKNEKTQEALEKIKIIDYDSLKRPELIGLDFDFEDIKNRVEVIVADLKEVDEHKDLIKVSRQNEEMIVSIISRLFLEVVEQSILFTAKDNANATNQYEAIRRSLDNIENDCIENLTVLTNQIKLKNLEPQNINNDVKQLNELKKEAEKLIADLSLKNEKAEKIVQQASGMEATKISSVIFKEQSVEHKNAAFYWLIGATAGFMILLWVLFGLFYGWSPFGKFDIFSVSDPYKIAHTIVFKLLILSTVYYTLHQCVKNYKVHRHLYVTNQHRHNALLVYPTIAVAGEDPETRNVIVEQAARSIFEQTTSGYLNFDDDPRPVNPTAIINKIIDKKT